MIASSERRIVARVRHDWAQEQQGGQRAHGLWRGICVQVTDKIVDGTTMWSVWKKPPFNPKSRKYGFASV